MSMKIGYMMSFEEFDSIKRFASKVANTKLGIEAGLRNQANSVNNTLTAKKPVTTRR